MEEHGLRAPSGFRHAGCFQGRRASSRIHYYPSEEESRMTLVRWTPGYRPARDLIGMQDDVNHFIHSFFGGDARWTDRAPFAPVVDIAETPEEFVIHADLPGVAQKDVKVSLLGDVLTLRGERQEETKENTGTVLRVERATGAFERSFRLGAPVRSD